MHERPRHALRNLIAEYGSALADDPPRLASFLRDECGAHKAEIHVLVEAANQRMPHEILAADREPIGIVVQRLAQRMNAERGTTREAALWAATSWAIALGRLEPGAAPQLDAAAPDPRASSDRPAPANVQPGEAGSANRPSRTPVASGSLVERAVGLVRGADGTPRWGVIGAMALAIALVSGAFRSEPKGDSSSDPKVEPKHETQRLPERSDAGAPRITAVRHLQQFPADGRKAWFHVFHQGSIDRIEVEFSQGNWRNLTLRPERTAHGTDFSFWLSIQQRQRGRARLTAFAGNTVVGAPHEIEFAAIGPGDPLLPATSSLAMTEVRYPREVPADGGRHTVEIHFRGDDAGLMSLELAVLRGRLEHQVITYAPSAARDGKVTFILTAQKPESILLRARLIDGQGRLSAPRDIPFTIVAQNRSSGAPVRR